LRALEGLDLQPAHRDQPPRPEQAILEGRELLLRTGAQLRWKARDVLLELLQGALDRGREDGELGRVIRGRDPQRRLGEVGDHQLRPLLGQHGAERLG
jgi:hypothetical protein